MPVWSEPVRYVVNDAPGIHQINLAMNAGNTMNIAFTAHQAAVSLTHVAYDAFHCIMNYCTMNMMQGNPMAAPLGSDNDAWDLVLRLVYYAHLVLDTVRANLVAHFNPWIQGTVLYAALVQNMHTIMLAAYMGAAWLRNTGWNQLGNDQELINFQNNLTATNVAGTPCPVISGLGTVELLCRVIARECLNRNTFAMRVQPLQIRQLPRPPRPAGQGWADCCNKAIPKTVFVCTGSDGAAFEEDKPANIVVATSQDEWGGFNIMQNFATRCRQRLRRLNWNGVGANREPLGIRPHSTTLRQQYIAAVTGAIPPVVTDNDRRNARRPVMTNWQHSVDHSTECATPYTCPGFQPKARCLRCQAFFQYDMQPIATLVGPEFTVLGMRELKSHLALTCAECIAHYGCCHAMLNGGFNNAMGQLTH